MHRSTWKKHERKAAAVLGTQRKPGSGSQGRADQTRSDTVHARLFIECKSRARCATRTLVNAARKLAKGEGKTAVIVERETGKPGAIWSVHQDDLPAFVAEWVAANYTPELMDTIYAAIKAAQGLDPDDF